MTSSDRPTDLMRESAAYLLNLIDSRDLAAPFTMTVRPGTAFRRGEYTPCSRGEVSAHWGPEAWTVADLDAFADGLGWEEYERRDGDRWHGRCGLVDLGGDLPVMVELIVSLPEEAEASS